VLRELLATRPGKLGAALLLVLGALSVWVVATYPLDYGPRRWNDPQAWADEPKAAPPAWTNLFGGRRRAEHRSLTATTPATVEQAGPAEVRTYQLPFTYTEDEPPTFLSFSMADVSYWSRPPSFAVVLVRPDRQEVPLLRDVIRGPRETETAPYLRHDETPLRVLLSAEPEVAEAAASMLGEAYGVEVSAADLRDRVEAALFGAPDASGELAPLHGDYRVDVRVAVADPRDVVGRVGAVVGGAVFGLLGTDTLGRDLAEGLLFGLPVALVIGLAAAVVSTAIGTGLGLLSGYRGGRTDLVIQRTADIVNNVPLLPLLIFMVFVLGAQLPMILLLLVAFSWPGMTILVRSMVLGLGSSQEVEAARAMGASTRHIIGRHIFPHTAPFVFTQLIFFVPAVILAEAGLSFLGLGDPSLPTWGQILEHAFRTGAVFLGYWWWVVSPGLLIVITAVTFMLLALGMEPVVNPRLRRRP
jgi:peptide/nickel transport system permease protein